MTDANDKPTPVFAAVARGLMRRKQEIMEYTGCRHENALEDARSSLAWEARLDGIAKGSILGLGAGGLLVSGMGVLSVFAGLSVAYFAYRQTQQAINQANMVDRAYTLYQRMSPAEFNQYLSSARSGPT